ncbi:MAG: AraC family transcriptional regulator [Butyrivibrio sp.]|nr:AraC family transcriptional regulator [Butyrivibrio sp.]
MRYRDLRIAFELSEVSFTILSIGEDTILTPFPRHSHSKNSYEFHYIKKGHGTIIADGITYKVEPGTFFVTGPEVFHEQVSDPEDVMVEYGMYLQVSVPKKLKPENPLSLFLNTTFHICNAGEEPARIMEAIFSELEEKRYGYELMLTALIEQYLLTVTRLYKDVSSERSPASTSSPADLTYLTIEEAFLYDYKDLTLPELAKRVNLGIRQTERLLNKHYNLTFNQKKAEARMSAALLLLRETKKSIAEISEELGFSTSEHFSNAFKKYYQATPGAYRKRMKML